MDEFAVYQEIPADQPGTRVVSIRGSMTIQHGAEIRTALLEALGPAENLLLDLAKVTEIDLIGLQFICSTHRSAIAGNKHFSVMKSGNEVIKEAMRGAGFDLFTGCLQAAEHTCIFAGGGE
jgi:anti-anti-sigma regulatory factor